VTTTPGTYMFTVHVVDSAKPTANQADRTYLVIVLPMIINETTAPTGTHGQAYSFKLTRSGGKAPVTYAVIDGALPPGVKFSTAGAFSGTPTTAGSYTVTVRAIDNGVPQNQATATFTILIS
jgi:hypothetical protein